MGTINNHLAVRPGTLDILSTCVTKSSWQYTWRVASSEQLIGENIYMQLGDSHSLQALRVYNMALT